jgi:hypothetical protein
MFWMTLLKGIMARPWIIALVVMGVMMGGMWININMLKGDIVDLRSDVVAIQANYDVCTNNEKNLLSGIETQKGSIDSLNTIIVGLQEQVTAEQETSEKWRIKYKDRPVITTIKEVPVIEYVDKGVVVDEETSAQYTDYYNVLFSD